MKIDKWVNVGSTKIGDRHVDTLVHIQFDGKRLSISGVEGPVPNGNCFGACGQIDLSNTVAWPGVNKNKLAKVWERWHLNDMRAGCEHQRQNWNPNEKLELVTYKLTTETLLERRKLIDSCENRLANGETVKLTDAERALVNLPWKTFFAPDADSFASGRYEVEKREEKAAGWVRPDEHPKGLLMAVCEVCGYRYGSSWLYEAVPDDVLLFLEERPPCDAPKGWR
jgi:hypothetical protein